ncbi:hypothetical protein [Chitinophaga qingshengii]|uniref:Universal stress protein n=1 Tax=Chitinophaga qingshengii TaxID=1569794 RepID=A0ABR7TH88_9BACT|nr:hypothetical protein [Chitinophaga qingshengii]MBC9928990.1 hypothetical protein [Chitinophaga qingshengii]
MKKILLAVDDGNFPEGAFEFARQMNEQEPIVLCGVFLPELNFTADISYTSIFVPLVENYAAASIQRSIDTFKEHCTRYNINYLIHRNVEEFALTTLHRESRFADLLLLSSEKFYADMLTGPDSYLNSALHQAECPLIISPEKPDFPESIILTYDGSASSVFAIKSFATLFPWLCRRKTLLLYATNKDTDVPYSSDIMELIQHHFANPDVQAVNTVPEKYFDTWLSEIGKPMVVTGAYGRSQLSRFFRHSFITDLLKTHRIPVFVAHR